MRLTFTLATLVGGSLLAWLVAQVPEAIRGWYVAIVLPAVLIAWLAYKIHRNHTKVREIEAANPRPAPRVGRTPRHPHILASSQAIEIVMTPKGGQHGE